MAVFTDPRDVTSVTLRAWFDASREKVADGQTVGTVKDWSGNALDLTQGTGAAQPAVRTTTSRRGKRLRYYDFDGTDDFVTASTAADWGFLHIDYSTVIVVCELDAHSVDGRSTILDTGGLSVADKGFWLACDNRGPANGGPDGMSIRATRSVGDVYTMIAGQDTFPTGQRHMIRVQTHEVAGSPESFTQVDGYAGSYIGDLTVTFTTGAPTAALRLGARNNATTLPFDGRVYEVIITSGELSVTDRDNLFKYLARKWELPVWKTDDEDPFDIAAGSVYSAFPTIAEVNNELVCVYREGTDHTSTFGDLRLRRSTDAGATWGAATTIFDGATENEDCRDPGIVKLANNTLLLTWSVRGVGGVGTSVADGCRWSTSTDAGATWAASQDLNDAFTGFSRCSCKPLQLPNGDLLWAIYGNDLGDANTTRWVKVYKSTNNATSWSYLADIGAIGDAKGWGEPNILRAHNGQLVALVRETNGGDLYRSVSNDDGATWTAPALVQADADSSPQGCVTRSGVLVIGQRFGTASDVGFLMTSFDNGATWIKGEPLHASGTNEYVSPVCVGSRIYVAYARESSSTDSDVFFRGFTEHSLTPLRPSTLVRR
jgi:hypothetical protein